VIPRCATLSIRLSQYVNARALNFQLVSGAIR
jgi:hypothetical protein